MHKVYSGAPGRAAAAPLPPTPAQQSGAAAGTPRPGRAGHRAGGGGRARPHPRAAGGCHSPWRLAELPFARCGWAGCPPLREAPGRAGGAGAAASPSPSLAAPARSCCSPRGLFSLPCRRRLREPKVTSTEKALLAPTMKVAVNEGQKERGLFISLQPR